MKKFISLCLVSIVLIAFCSCGRGEEDDGKALLTADSTINVTSNAGVITLNEDVVAIMLGVFSPEHLGLSDVIESYTLKLGATKVFGNVFYQKDCTLQGKCNLEFKIKRILL